MYFEVNIAWFVVLFMVAFVSLIINVSSLVYAIKINDYFACLEKQIKTKA